MDGIKASFYRELKTRLSSRRVFIENIANPLFVLFIFGTTLGNSIGEINEGVPYLSYFVIGAINISLVSNALVAATKIFVDKYVGLYDELLTYPVDRESILLGKLLFNLMLSIIQSLVMLMFVSMVIGKYELSIINLMSLLLLITIGSSTWFYCMIVLAIKLESHDSFNTMYFLIMTPVIYISSIYYPVDKMPVILKVIGNLNPLTWLTDIGRTIYIGIPTDFFIFKIIGLILLLIVSRYIANRSFKYGNN